MKINNKQLNNNFIINSFWYSYFVNKFVKNGKKKKMYNLFNKIFFQLGKKFSVSPVFLLFKIIYTLEFPLYLKKVYKRGELRKKTRKRANLQITGHYGREFIELKRSLNLAKTFILSEKKSNRKKKFDKTQNKGEKKKKQWFSRKKKYKDRYHVATNTSHQLKFLVYDKLVSLFETNIAAVIKTNYITKIIQRKSFYRFVWQKK